MTAAPVPTLAASRRPLPPLPADPHPHVHVERIGEGGWVFRPIAPAAPTAVRTPPAHGRRSRGLTARQVEVLQSLADHGGTNADIGRRLHLTEQTVKSHMQRAARTLGANDRAHAVYLALRDGWLT